MGKILDSTKLKVGKLEFSIFITKVMGKYIVTVVKVGVHFPAFVKDFTTYEDAGKYYVKQVEKLTLSNLSEKKSE